MPAFSTAEKEQIYQIMGLPKAGSAVEVKSIADYFGPSYEPYEFSALITQLDAAIATCDAATDRRARVQALLVEADAITPYSELEVQSSGGSVGVLVNDPLRYEKIRQELCKLLAFYVPKGGFFEEIRRRNRGGNQIPR